MAAAYVYSHRSHCTCGVCPQGGSVVGDWFKGIVLIVKRSEDAHPPGPQGSPFQPALAPWVTFALSGAELAEEPSSAPGAQGASVAGGSLDGDPTQRLDESARRDAALARLEAALLRDRLRLSTSPFRYRGA
jgi:hypothetical protein